MASFDTEGTDELGVDVDYRQGDLRDLPVSGSFDAVVCWFTSFGYFDDDDNRTVLDEFVRVLKPGGRLLIETMHHDGSVRGFVSAPEATVTERGPAEQSDGLSTLGRETDAAEECLMAMRHVDLTEEQLELQRAYQRSWDAAQKALADPEYRAWLEESIERVNKSSATPVTARSKRGGATTTPPEKWTSSA